MTTQEQEAIAINKAFGKNVESIFSNFIVLYAGAVNAQEREATKTTFQHQIMDARSIRDLAIAMLPD